MFTYFVQGAPCSPVKIGRAADVEVRVAQLQTGSCDTLRVLLVLDGDRECEMHKLFAKHRIRGEWFFWCSEISEFIRNSTNAECPWHLVNVYCTDQQREEFNAWCSEAYLLADSICDWVRHKSVTSDCDIPPEMERLMHKLCQVPLLVK